MTNSSPSDGPGRPLHLTGTDLGDYRILRQLGAGAMATVYLAEQMSLTRQVAVKVLNPELAEDETYVKRFRNEATSAAALVHANIVQIYEVGEIDGLHFIAQEYVPGQTLGALIERDGALPIPMAVTIMRQVAAALAKAADHQIVHRDIKPDNILLTTGGEVKVADFGLARASRVDGVDLTQVGVTMGTPLYMSPEQIEGKELTAASDIYSLGVTAWHSLVGHPPFTGETALAVAVQHVNSKVPPLAEEAPHVPEQLRKVIDRMLAKQLKDRYANGRELLADLRKLCRDLQIDDGWADWSSSEGVPGEAVSSNALLRLSQAMRTQAVKQPSRRRMRWIAAIVLGLLVGGVAAYFLRPTPLLSQEVSDIPTKDDVWAQLYYAKSVNLPTAWRSVIDKFPQQTEVHYLAEMGLARYYLFTHPNYSEAKMVCERLTQLTFRNPEATAFGFAGLVIAEAELGNLNAAQEAFDAYYAWTFTANLDSPLDREMDNAFRAAVDKLPPTTGS